MTGTLSSLERTSPVSDKALAQYRRDGFVVIPRLFAGDEIEILCRTAERDMPGADVLTKRDQDGNTVSLKMWNNAGDDIYGMFSRNARMVAAAERVIGSPVYLYSAKNDSQERA